MAACLRSKDSLATAELKRTQKTQEEQVMDERGKPGGSMEWMGGWVDCWIDGWMDGWIDGWVGGLLDRWVDGWMGGWIVG